REISEKYSLSVDPAAKIADISVGMQQRVEILKTLYRGAEILIFDEPTAVLTPQEIKELSFIMKALIKEGKSIILITHKLKEIMEICDRVTVIRKGVGIGTLEVDRKSTRLNSSHVKISYDDLLDLHSFLHDALPISEILIFDEPTAVLTPQEIKELSFIMKALIKEGKSIILITHKLKEIMEICDRVTVIRKGVGIGTLE